MVDVIHKDALTEEQKVCFEIARETGIDHMMSMWNAVGLRVKNELPADFLLKDYVAIQINTGAQCIIELFLHIREVLLSAGGKIEALDFLVQGFQVAMISGVNERLEEIHKTMN